MKITAIKQQAKRADRYSIFVEGRYAFSLSESALIESRLNSGQELNSEQLKGYKQLSSDDKIANQALRYVAMRPRSTWELSFYLERKKASPTLVTKTLNKLSNIGLLDDKKFAQSFVRDRQLLRPSSRRKIIAELKKKRISEEIITAVISEAGLDESQTLKSVIASKRRQTKYQDDLKLMQYLARQGFSYEDIKAAL